MNKDKALEKIQKCLNPCCNGIYLIISARVAASSALSSLNPCCNGIYLIILAHELKRSASDVLILVVMEYT